MNATLTVLVSTLAAAAVACAVVFVMPPQAANDLQRGGADEAALAKANARVLELEGELERIDGKMEAFRRLSADAEALLQIQPAKIAALEAALARLEGQVEKKAASGRLTLENGEEVALDAFDVLIDERVEQAMEKRAQRDRRRPLEAFEPMIRMGMMRQVSRQARQLELDPVQTKRLEESATKAFEKITPHFGTVLDPQAKPEEKEQAFVEIKNEIDEVNRDASSYMTPDQHDQFTALQQTQLEQMQQFQAMMTSGGGGGAGGFSGFGAPGGGGGAGPDRAPQDG